MTDSSPEHTAQRASGTGPGRLIREARETARLSIEDLAAQIKLSRHTLDALERDDFANLTEPVYVRGYYRKLCKVLPLAEAEVIGAYDSILGPKPQVLAPNKLILAGGQDLGASNQWNKLAVFAGMLITALVIALVAFWATRHSEVSPRAVVSQPAPQAQPVTPLATQAVPAEAVPTTPAAPTAEAAPAVPAAAPAQAQSQLTLEYLKDCWTRIEDADGKTLVSGIIAAGEKQTYTGTPPFSIAFGHAAGVQLKLNGTPVDLSRYTRPNGSAHFKLP